MVAIAYKRLQMVRLQLVISGYSLPLHGILNGHIHNILRLSQQVGEFESYGGFGAQFVGALSAGAPIARRSTRRVALMCLKLDMHVLSMYVYIDAPGVLGVLYVYVCMYVLRMHACTQIGAAIAIRRADRRAGW